MPVHNEQLCSAPLEGIVNCADVEGLGSLLEAEKPSVAGLIGWDLRILEACAFIHCPKCRSLYMA